MWHTFKNQVLTWLFWGLFTAYCDNLIIIVMWISLVTHWKVIGKRKDETFDTTGESPTQQFAPVGVLMRSCDRWFCRWKRGEKGSQRRKIRPSTRRTGGEKIPSFFHPKKTCLGGGNSNIFYFHPYLGKIPILTNIFQRGWNHQLDVFG